MIKFTLKYFTFFFLLCLIECTNKPEITFSENIAPIIHKNCTPCHRSGQGTPFDLITYNDVAKRAKTILKVIQNHAMPPWPADVTYTHFIGEKQLTEQEIKLIQQWVEAGVPLGDSLKLAQPPVFPEGSILGNPDLVVKMTEPYLLKGNNTDNFLLMKIPFELPKDTFIRAIEFVAGNKKIVHHVNGHLLRYENAKKKNVFDGEKVVDSQLFGVKEAYEKMKLSNDDGTYPVLKMSFVNYLPGVEPTLYPEGIGGFFVNKKSAIFLKDIHYGPTPTDQTDQSYFNIFFDKAPPKRQTLEMQLGTLGISTIIPPLVIPPNEIKTFRTQTIAPMDMSLLTINPHMHLLGKVFLAYAVSPIGDTIPLIRINNWDFRWQYFYTFKKPVKIPKGSIITAIGTFDNTTNNPNNPFNPPQTVSERNGSMRTTDEMFQFIITYLPYKAGDENISLENARLK